jgi:CBS domain-containing protein
MSYLVKHYMNKEVRTIEDTASVVEAAQKIVETDEGYLIVLNKGGPSGIVTENDFVKKVIAQRLDPGKLTIREIMSSPLVTADPEEDLLKATEIMKQHKIRRIPVVKDSIIYGIITASDVAIGCGEYVDRSVRDIVRWASPFR